ncbi:hypothetical protein E2C01_041830 [Portunus trituberculatus]|uniref:Uncharacterized protein n=1 Tax=Portunus trituberculatus TaxID=210409 RepID=A0A5B7FRQ4_PORTR|nr:hypothetical protein [Portunus trituberculatus]
MAITFMVTGKKAYLEIGAGVGGLLRPKELKKLLDFVQDDGKDELDPRNFNNIRAISCRKMVSTNAWRDGNEIAMR